MRLVLVAMLAAGLVSPAAAALEEAKFPLPKSGTINVAFLIADDTTLIDVAGPMQTFDQVQSSGRTGFRTYTVSTTRKPVHAGTMTVVPDYTFDDAPQADIVVVGAQSKASPKAIDYLKRMAAENKLLLSVCTGASKLAVAGLLDGKEATTHHDYVDQMQKLFPKVHFVSDRAWVHAAPRIYTAGGETNGIELALHIVELYFDHDVAVKTARYMDYRGPDWQK